MPRVIGGSLGEAVSYERGTPVPDATTRTAGSSRRSSKGATSSLPPSSPSRRCAPSLALSLSLTHPYEHGTPARQTAQGNHYKNKNVLENILKNVGYTYKNVGYKKSRHRFLKMMAKSGDEDHRTEPGGVRQEQGQPLRLPHRRRLALRGSPKP